MRQSNRSTPASPLNASPLNVSLAQRAARALSWMGLTLMVGLLWFGHQSPTQARLDPYYIVRGASFGTITPRVLFALDTSGSMGRQARAGEHGCVWGECENPAFYGTEDESRISAARRAVRQVVAGAGESADFAFMTFHQNDPEEQANVPMCENYSFDGGTTIIPTRFSYIRATRRRDGDVTWLESIVGSHGEPYVGALRLCQDPQRRPYPYIRWDELGNGSVIDSNNLTDEVPPSPLISLAGDDYITISNMQRRVQFFPDFMGVRVQLNATTDPDQDVLNATVGDYNSADVYNQDFYYWPYVDGFPGYATMVAGVFEPSDTEFDMRDQTGNPGSGLWYFDGTRRVGVAASNNAPDDERALLHAPFFLDLSGASPSIDEDDWGPADRQSALETTLSRTSPLIEGGVDADGATPWADAVGEIPGTPDRINSVGSHGSIASYLSFVTSVETSTVCAPTSAVLLTDGEPSSGQGGNTLYQRLAALRTELNVSVYVVGFFLGGDGALNEMACAGAGACDGGSCDDPCDDEPAQEWDTCRDPDNPEEGCAYIATSTAELQAILAGIIGDALEVEVDSGPDAVVNEFGAGTAEDADAVQTIFSTGTDYPGWRGHVERRYCSSVDGDGELLPSCQVPDPEFDPDLDGDEVPDDPFETFGECARSRSWDAGECLALMDFDDRRLYSHDNAGVYRIWEGGGASTRFVAALQAEPTFDGGGTVEDQQAAADEIAAFVLGRDVDWKLPGISNSSPITVRRVPQFDPLRLPEVGINDPHCAGRRFGNLDAGTLPDSLEDFARDAWNDGPNYTYQEAVVVGDDFGVIHGFQLESGNELFGLIPRFALGSLIEQAANGAANMGQPEEGDLENHIYGVASTLNHGWAFDRENVRWRHVGVFGMGPGGHELIALDLSHMSPDADGAPVDVLWTTADEGGEVDAALYDQYLGETWARPALSYHVPNDQIGVEPSAFLVFGSGYAQESADASQGRTLVVADAITGEIIETTQLPDVTTDVYESAFGSVVDPAVTSHCLSRYWAEAQEMYLADPAGRLFRWDLGRDVAPLTFSHAADSGGEWGTEARAVFTFPACTGTGTSCNVSGTNPADPFLFAPAVSAFNRIDDVTSGAVADVVEDERFLVALVSGSPNDDTIDGGDEDNDFHTSIYLLVDDHRGDAGEGFNIPAGAPTSGGAFAAGSAISGNPGYMRIAVSDIERTRRVTPYPGATPFSEVRNFSKAARPIRAPRIHVSGVIVENGEEPPTIVEDVEVYTITYFIYEPGSGECDSRYYDSENDQWYADRGSTYELNFRLTADALNGFEFNNGSSGGGAPVDFADIASGLELVSVEQSGIEGECESGNCGAQASAPTSVPCDNNDASDEAVGGVTFAVPTASRQLDGFTPVEQ